MATAAAALPLTMKDPRRPRALLPELPVSSIAAQNVQTLQVLKALCK